MGRFDAKAEPQADKLRGGYYTPSAIAAFLAGWATAQDRSADRRLRVLEPSCGDGAILKYLDAPGLDVTGVELVSAEASKAADLEIGTVANQDFFAWLEEQSPTPRFDAVVGNPPYIRFGSWDDAYRRRALAFIEDRGLKPSKLTNAWVPFVVAAVDVTAPGGRVGLVLPAELLQVGYAAQLRDYLIAHCAHISIVSFQTLVFPGVLQEVVLLLAEVGQGPASVRAFEVPDLDSLASLRVEGEEVRASLHPGEKWTRYYLGPRSIRSLRLLQDRSQFRPLSDYARVNVGVVTGRNSFFCLTADDARRLGLDSWTTPLLARSAHAHGIRFTAEDLLSNDCSGYRTRLLTLPEQTAVAKHPALAAYLADGEAEGVHTGYKTRIRRRWWAVPSVSVPDAFILRQISTVPRVYANKAAATSTDTIHRVFIHDGSVTGEQLAVAALNSVTCALAEVIGRSYGGGILELEPTEAASLLIPDPAAVTTALADRVDALLRAGEEEAARSLVDEELLHGVLGMSRTSIWEFEHILSTMQSRRISRSRSPLAA